MNVLRTLSAVTKAADGDWRAKGHTISFTDATISAVAMANQSPLLTDNRKHFPMPKLNLFPLLDG